MENKKFVVLIEVPKFLSFFNQPKIGEYDNPYIRKIIPCTVQNGKYRSWEGEEINKNSQMQEWNLFVGTMFLLKNGKEMLITRDFAGHVFLTEGINFNPLSMVRYVAK